MNAKLEPLVLTTALALACTAETTEPSAEEDGTLATANVEKWELEPGSECPGDYAGGSLDPGAIEGFAVADQDRRFFLALPDAAKFEGPRPLLLFFHGSDEDVGLTAEGGFDHAQLRDFVDAGFIVASLHAAMNGTIWPFWDDIRDASDQDRDNKDLAYFDTVSRCVAAHHEVDKNRVFVAGVSAGGSMANVVIQNRSEVLAGGITSSGIFDLTTPPDPTALDEMFVVVSWTGEDDVAGAGGGTVQFFEQASLASLYYAEDPIADSVAQANCHADPTQEHGWMRELNPWYIDRMLDRPKGMPRADGEVLPPGPKGYTCESSPFRYVSDVAVSCPPVDPVACTDVCQVIADCAVANATVGPVVGEQVMAMGFSGEGNTDCSGCTTMCAETELTAADLEVIGCMTDGRIECGAGVEGFQPFADGIDGCCAGRDDSPYCVNICEVMLTNDLAPTFFPNCVELVGE